MKKMKVLFLALVDLIRSRTITSFSVFNMEPHVGLFMQETFLTRASAELYIKQRLAQWDVDLEQDRKEIAELIAEGLWPADDTEPGLEPLQLSILERKIYL